MTFEIDVMKIRAPAAPRNPASEARPFVEATTRSVEIVTSRTTSAVMAMGCE